MRRATWCCSCLHNPSRSAAPWSRPCRSGARCWAGRTAASASCCNSTFRRAPWRSAIRPPCGRAPPVSCGPRRKSRLHCCRRGQSWKGGCWSCMQTLPDERPGFRWASWIVLTFVLLLPTVGPAEAVLSLGALTAAGLLLWQRFKGGTRLLSREAWALTTALFFAYWLPELFAAPDAIDRASNWKDVATDLRYLPFLWLAAMAMGTARSR